MKTASTQWALSSLLALTLAACGGGGGSGTPVSTGPTTGPTGVTTSSSSGAITAFGSVFVNGHEYDTASAQVVDDDTGASERVSDLEVGQVVDVDPASNSTASAPVAKLLHVHPLVRGDVDAWDGTADTLTVMGQVVSLDSATLFADHRACVNASANPCTPITDASGLALTSTGSGGTTPGSYVSIDGYLFGGSGAANVVATLVSVRDTPTGTGGAFYKVEGLVTAVTATSGSTSITIGGLQIDLSSATCRPDFGKSTACTGAFAAGDVVSVYATTAPALPATTLTAAFALKRSRLPVQTAGAAVEFDGSVSASTPASGTMAATFTVRGVSVDTSGLPAGTSLPAVGDLVWVEGTLSSDGLSVAATSIRILRAARSVSYAFCGDETSIAAGSTANTYTLTVLGVPVVVSSQTRLADHSSRHWFTDDPQANPFNITTFQAYLTASASQHVVINAAKDSSGNVQALSLTIMPASTVSQVAGPVDATPAPVAGSSTAPSTFSIDGVPVSAAVNTISFGHHSQTAIAAGDEVITSGTFTSGILTITSPRNLSNFVIDGGVPLRQDVPLL